MSERFSNVKEVAINLARESGLINLTREKLCNAVGMPVGSFPHFMGCNFTDFVASIADEVGESGYGHGADIGRANPNLRKTQILNVAIELSRDIGYQHITRSKVADAARISEGLVTRYFSTMNQLKREVMRTAIKREILEIIAQGLIAQDKYAKKADQQLKEKALQSLAG